VAVLVTIPDQQELAAAFALRCCACGQPACLVTVGADAVVEVGITLTRAIADHNLCRSCADRILTGIARGS